MRTPGSYFVRPHEVDNLMTNHLNNVCQKCKSTTHESNK